MTEQLFNKLKAIERHLKASDSNVYGLHLARACTAGMILAGMIWPSPKVRPISFRRSRLCPSGSARS